MAGGKGGGGALRRLWMRARGGRPLAGSAAAVPDMFTLCMSRGHPPLADAHHPTTNSELLLPTPDLADRGSDSAATAPGSPGFSKALPSLFSQ